MNVIIEVKVVDYDKESNEGYVEALIEDYTNIKEDNEEVEGFPVDLFYANFSLSEEETIPEDHEELCIFFEELDLRWKPVTP
jgi:hypothetical protein